MKAANRPEAMFELGQLIVKFQTQISEPVIPSYSLPRSDDPKPIADLKKMLATMPAGDNWDTINAALGYWSDVDQFAHTLTECSGDLLDSDVVKTKPEVVIQHKHRVLAAMLDMKEILKGDEDAS